MIAVHAFLREHRDEILRSWEALVADDPSSGGPALRERLPSLLDLLVRSLETVAPPREAPDSDEIRALRESEARLKAMADGTPLAIWSTDAKGGVEFVNRAYCEFFGVTQEEVATRGWQPLIHPEDAPGYVAAFMESLALRKPFHALARVRRADGAWRWIESFGQPRLSEDGTFLGVAGSSPDVTERKHAEDELRLADQRKSEFLAVLSHELRNPLAPIRNSIFLLERAAPGSAQAVRAREVLDRQAGHLTRLVDDLLDVTRVSRGKIDLRRTRIDLRDVVRKTTDDMRSIFEASAVALEVERPVGPIWVDGDATRLAQVLGNLLQNAVKFTPPAGKVVVHVAAVEGKGTLSVRDTGAGMQPDDVDRMFQPFEQGGQGMARTRGGLGLGLALVKGLVELHGGAVRATSAGPGRGSEFVVTLPLAEVAVPARRAERADGAPGKNELDALLRGTPAPAD